MRAVRFVVVALLLSAACGVRTPPPVDVAALIRTRGEPQARLALRARVLAHPRDVQARLALADLDDRTGHPTEAIEQLETVEHLGGPLGTRWHASDRERLGRLLLARGRARLARGAASALADLERAQDLGVAPSRDELVSAKVAVALADLRQVDDTLRARGRASLATLAHDAKPGTDEAAWAGARPDASPVDHGTFGAWLWTIGARRESYEQLARWHGATKAPRDEALQAAYLRAVAWWSPFWLGEAVPPPAEDLVGPERCWFPGADCPPPPIEELPLPPLDAAPAGAPPHARDTAATRYAATRIAGATAADLLPIAAAYRRDPAIADRLARDLVDRSVDAAAGNASVGALFDALGDPARARAHWQAAVDASPEPQLLRGLAESTAHTGDGPAALVFGTKAAASSGDPAVVWTAVAAALLDANQLPDSLTASRSALDLAGPDMLPAALDTAIAASRALGRTQQADALLVQRAQLAPRKKTDDTELRSALAEHRDHPNASTVARLWVASRTNPRDIEARAVLLDELEPDDPRRQVIVDELLVLAGDPDPTRAVAAAHALRD
jgi:tetratricopeptide (TPR) repeat protein